MGRTRKRAAPAAFDRNFRERVRGARERRGTSGRSTREPDGTPASTPAFTRESNGRWWRTELRCCALPQPGTGKIAQLRSDRALGLLGSHDGDRKAELLDSAGQVPAQPV